MSIQGLYNKRCSWKRLSQHSENEWGESTFTEVVVASDVPCRYETLKGQELQEYQQSPDFNRALGIMYLDYRTDVQANDKVRLYEIGGYALGSENYTVVDPDDAAGHEHHLEVLLEKTKELVDNQDA